MVFLLFHVFMKAFTGKYLYISLTDVSQEYQIIWVLNLIMKTFTSRDENIQSNYFGSSKLLNWCAMSEIWDWNDGIVCATLGMCPTTLSHLVFQECCVLLVCCCCCVRCCCWLALLAIKECSWWLKFWFWHSLSTCDTFDCASSISSSRILCAA